MECYGSKEDTYNCSISWTVMVSAVSTCKNSRTFLCVFCNVVIDVDTIDTNCVHAVDISIVCTNVIEN